MALKYGNKCYDRFGDGPLLWTGKWTEMELDDQEKTRTALLFISHGLGEHFDYYDELGYFLVNSGFRVFTHDHIGHGTSSGTHSHVGNFKEYTKLIFDHCDEMKKNYPDLPIFLFGHSIGGAAALLAALEKPEYFKGVIISSPFVIPPKVFSSSVEMFYFKNIGARMFPQQELSQIDPNEVSRDPKKVDKIKNDPLFHTAFKAGLWKAWLDCATKLQQNFSSIKVPLLVLHGEADKIGDIKFSQNLYDEAQSQDKELKIYPGCLHNPILELEEDRKQVLEDIKQWLEKRI